MPARSVNDARFRATHEAAMAIIDAERKKRDDKTARLRAAREAAERTGKDRGSKSCRLREKQGPASRQS